MPKLFAAIPLPHALCDEFKRMQPSPANGVRLVSPDQMHLTLHYIGEADRTPVVEALRAVMVSEFEIVFAGVGAFPSAGGATTLWAGVQESAELLGLHAALGSELSRIGFRQEAQPYKPHVTLARCESDAADRVAKEFLARNEADFALAAMVTEFALFSSEMIRNAPVYRREQAFPFRPSA